MVLFGAAALDAFWATPRREPRVRQIQPIVRCAEPTPRKVEDIQLLAPTQAVR